MQDSAMSGSVIREPPSCLARQAGGGTAAADRTSVNDNIPPGAGAVLEIDLDAVADNWRLLKMRVGASVECAGVVKANGYGLGARKVAPALWAAGCRTFFVAHLEEGVELRRVLPQAEIAVLNGLLGQTADEFAAHRLIPVLNDLGQLAAWKGRAEKAILHIDTGMSRLGLPLGEVAVLAAEPERLAGLDLAWVMSHLACADEPDHAQNPTQIAAFRAALARLPKAKASLAASSGILLGSDYHFDMVRPGVALWGVNPLPGTPNPMRPVVRLKARILQVRDVDPGATAGYGATHRMTGPGRLATVAAGYADGLLRSLSGSGTARIGSHVVPIVGRVSMDLIILDVTALPRESAEPGLWAEMIGPGHDVDAVAAEAGTIGYEILTSLGARYHRVYTGGGQ
jgi:alanine racemase